MKSKELNFDKLGLTNKRTEYVARHYRELKFKDIPLEKARQEFIRQLNEKGYVPLKIKVIPESDYFVSTAFLGKVRYGVISAFCIYFGKRNAPKIKEIEMGMEEEIYIKRLK